MKKSTLNLHTRVSHNVRHLREEFTAQRERGGISVEYVVIAVGLFTLATLVLGLVTVWATGKLGDLI